MTALRTIILVLFNAIIFSGLARDLKIESFTERPEDLTARTYTVLDRNKERCALIKISIPDKAAFEGNVIQTEYKTNEYFVYVSPRTKKLVLKYPGFETLEIQLSDYLDGSGVESGMTYRLKLSDIYDEVPQLTIVLPDNEKIEVTDTIIPNDNLGQQNSIIVADNLEKPEEQVPEKQPELIQNETIKDSIPKIDFKNEMNEILTEKMEEEITKKKKSFTFSVKPQFSIGLGNSLAMKSDITLQKKNTTSNNFGIDLGFNIWEDTKNYFTLNFGLGYNSINLKLGISDFSYNYFALPSADMDSNTYYRYYDINSLEEEISSSYLTIPVYFGYTYNITKRLGFYLNLGVNIGFKAGSNLKSVSGNGYVYGVYPEYGDLKIDEPYLNGFGNVSFNNAQKQKVNTSGVTGSLLAGLGVDFKVAGPLWVNLGIKYNLGVNNIFKYEDSIKGGFSNTNSPVTYTVAEGEMINPLSNYLSKSNISSLLLDLGITLKF